MASGMELNTPQIRANVGDPARFMQVASQSLGNARQAFGDIALTERAKQDRLDRLADKAKANERADAMLELSRNADTRAMNEAIAREDERAAYKALMSRLTPVPETPAVVAVDEPVAPVMERKETVVEAPETIQLRKQLDAAQNTKNVLDPKNTVGVANINAHISDLEQRLANAPKATTVVTEVPVVAEVAKPAVRKEVVAKPINAREEILNANISTADKEKLLKLRGLEMPSNKDMKALLDNQEKLKAGNAKAQLLASKYGVNLRAPEFSGLVGESLYDAVKVATEGSKDTGGGSVNKSLDSLYKRYGSPDFYGTGDEANIEENIRELMDKYKVSESKMSKLVDKWGSTYKTGATFGVNEDFWTNIEAELKNKSK